MIYAYTWVCVYIYICIYRSTPPNTRTRIQANALQN